MHTHTHVRTHTHMHTHMYAYTLHINTSAIYIHYCNSLATIAVVSPVRPPLVELAVYLQVSSLTSTPKYFTRRSTTSLALRNTADTINRLDPRDTAWTYKGVPQ